MLNLRDFATRGPCALFERVRQTAGTTLLVRQCVLDQRRSISNHLVFPSSKSIVNTPVTGIPVRIRERSHLRERTEIRFHAAIKNKPESGDKSRIRDNKNYHRPNSVDVQRCHRLIRIAFPTTGLESSRDDRNSEIIRTGTQESRTNCEDEPPWFENANCFPGRERAPCDSDFGADYQGNIRETQKSHAGIGESLSTIESFGPARFGLTRKRFKDVGARNPEQKLIISQNLLVHAMGITGLSIKGRLNWSTGSFRIMGLWTTTHERPFIWLSCWPGETATRSMRMMRSLRTR